MVTRADARTLFAAAWIAQSLLMGVSAGGGLLGGGTGLVWAALTDGQVGSGEVWLYSAPAPLQVVVSVFAFAGALSVLRGRSGGVRTLRQASIWLLISIALTCVLIPWALLASMPGQVMGWALAAVVVAGGLLMAVLPAATLKWIQDEEV